MPMDGRRLRESGGQGQAARKIKDWKRLGTCELMTSVKRVLHLFRPGSLATLQARRTRGSHPPIDLTISTKRPESIGGRSPATSL
jgi:hypothetical protein